MLSGAGLGAVVLPRPLPTPVLAYAIRALGCAGGVMVTASHNPPQDNGYKVYLGDGSQIVPPADAEISARIDSVGRLADVPRGEGWSVLGDDVLEPGTSTGWPAWSTRASSATCASSTRRCTASAATWRSRSSRPAASRR